MSVSAVKFLYPYIVVLGVLNVELSNYHADG